MKDETLVLIKEMDKNWRKKFFQNWRLLALAEVIAIVCAICWLFAIMYATAFYQSPSFHKVALASALFSFRLCFWQLLLVRFACLGSGTTFAFSNTTATVDGKRQTIAMAFLLNFDQEAMSGFASKTA